MSFTDARATRATRGLQRLDAEGALVRDLAKLRIGDSDQGPTQVGEPETSPQQVAITDFGVTNPATPAKSAVASDLTPSQTAQRLVEWSTAKSDLSADRLTVLSVLAGVFIALGGAFFTAVMAELSLTHGPSRYSVASPFPPDFCSCACPARSSQPATA